MTGSARSYRSIATALLAGMGALSATRRTLADPPIAQVSVTYERQPGAESCPAEPVLREQVALRLGYDPFRDQALHHVSVSIAPKAGGLHASIKTFSMSADSSGSALRELDSEGDGCEELLQSVVLAVSLAIDPMGFARPRAAPRPAAPRTPPAVPAPATSATPAEVPAPSPSPRSPPWTVELIATARLGLGLVPGPSVGPVVDLRLGKRGWALFAEGGADLPTSSRSPPGSAGPGVEASLIRGGAGACGLVAWLSLCGRADLGALQGNGQASFGKTATTLYADVAIAAGLDIPVAHDIRAIASAELLAPLTPTTLHIGSAQAWRTPTLAGAFDLGVGYRF